jgi:manganese transport protein
MAFFVNAAILVVAAAAFHARGQFDVEGLEKAHELLRPMLGGAAATAFAVALLASGQSSTITGTLAGQIVMEGFLNFRIAPWLRRLITRSLAIIPAMVLIGIKGENHTVNLLIFSQVVLSMQLSFAIFPLLAFTSDKKRMGEHANPLWLKLLGLVVCTLIAGLNIKYLADSQGLLPVLAGAAVMAAFAVWVTWGYKDKSTLAKPSES